MACCYFVCSLYCSISALSDDFKSLWEKKKKNGKHERKGAEKNENPERWLTSRLHCLCSMFVHVSADDNSTNNNRDRKLSFNVRYKCILVLGALTTATKTTSRTRRKRTCQKQYDWIARRERESDILRIWLLKFNDRSKDATFDVHVSQFRVQCALVCK